MENLIKKIILFSIIGIAIYSAILFILNNNKTKEMNNNNLVNQSINNKDFEDPERIEKIIQSIDESYNSTNTIKLLYVSKLIEDGSYDKSIEVLNNISGSQSTATKELVYSLKAKAFAHKGLCEKSKEYSKKITSHDSIKEISKDDVLVCENQ